METQERADTDKLRQDPKVKKALEACTTEKEQQEKTTQAFSTKDRTALIVIVLTFIAAGLFYYLFGLKFFTIRSRYIPLLQKLMASTMLAMVVLLLVRLLKIFLLSNLDNPSTRYNLNRILDLVAALLIFFMALSLLFVNWYTAVVSLGLISLILGLALQNPITSFFAWLYILIRKPYEVGDRIKIGSATGDVIELGYFDTTLWEFNGDYLSGDHPSGRIIKFANSKVFDEFVYNYSWPLFPYIWNEINFFVAYESNLQLIGETAKKVVEQEIGDEMIRRVNLYRNILSQTPVGELPVRERAAVSFRAHDNTWIEVVVRYLVEPKEAGKVKNKLFALLMQQLASAPEKVLFPKSNMR